MLLPACFARGMTMGTTDNSDKNKNTMQNVIHLEEEKKKKKKCQMLAASSPLSSPPKLCLLAAMLPFYLTQRSHNGECMRQLL